FQYADIEALVLSGELFNGPERSSSPVRTPSPDAGWHDDELAQQPPDSRPQHESIGMGPGRTGVKGVIRDRDEANDLRRERRALEIDRMRTAMENTSLTGRSFLEEEREKPAGERVDPLVQQERERDRHKTDMFGRSRAGRFGHLREVGVAGFVAAVEKEDHGVWVILHLYDPSLDRCYLLDETLGRLARAQPSTKFLRARASALGFASSNSSRPRKITTTQRRVRDDDDDDDPYSDKDESEDREEDPEDDNVDLDMLPTMLVYRDGELVHNWVRVDWEAGPPGIEDLLQRSVIYSFPLHAQESIFGAFPSDDEGDGGFDLIWSDEED
ncbi:thioredoxin-like protein, partial [Infundibulicybe gibba]